MSLFRMCFFSLVITGVLVLRTLLASPVIQWTRLQLQTMPPTVDETRSISNMPSTAPALLILPPMKEEEEEEELKEKDEKEDSFSNIPSPAPALLPPMVDEKNNVSTNLSLATAKDETLSSKMSLSGSCPYGRPNTLVLGNIQPAGLNDRVSVFKQLANLAEPLCATVRVPSPSVLLSDSHNVNFPPMDSGVSWNDLLDMRCSGHGDSSTPIVTTYFDEKQSSGTVLDNNTAAMVDGNFESRDEATAAEDLRRVQSVWLEQQANLSVTTASIAPFTWTINPKSTYAWLNAINASKSPSFCSFRASTKVQEIAQSIMNGIRDVSGSHVLYGSLHIRRSDTVGVCDSSLATMREYFDCSLRNTSSLNRTMIVLFYSDEKDAAYRQSILDLPTSNATGNVSRTADLDHVQVIDLDMLVLDKIRRDIDEGIQPSWLNNNYIVFDVVQQIRSWAHFGLAKYRTKHCNPCDPVLGRLQRVLASNTTI